MLKFDLVSNICYLTLIKKNKILYQKIPHLYLGFLILVMYSFGKPTSLRFKNKPKCV